MRKSLKLGMGFAAALTAVGPAMAADHQDGTISPSSAALGDPASDITDVYSWMTADKSKVNFIMNVFPGATSKGTPSLFSTATKYVFHTASQAGLLSSSSTKRDIICTFTGTSVPQTTTCWITDGGTNVSEYATGNASVASAPAQSFDKKVSIFAGSRNDPFFFNLAGFRNATAATAAAIAATTGSGMSKAFITGFDTAAPGCPILTSAARGVVTQYLDSDCTGAKGATAQDFFKNPVTAESIDCTLQTKPPTYVNTTQTTNEGTTGTVLSLIIQVDSSVLTLGGPAVSVWGATTK